MKKFIIVFFVISSLFTSAQKFQNLALTPPMGWNSWNKFACNVSEKLLKETADAMVSSGMRDAGYQYIVIDDCWQISRDSMGFIVADPAKFPSGIKALADYIHSKGLKFGIYSCAGTKTCAGRPGGRGHEFQDAYMYAQRLVDKSYSWDDLKLLVPDMISAGLIGHPFTCPDMIGGGLISTFSDIDYNKFDQELFIRSAQIQALMPMMQFSIAPWRVLDEKHLNICRDVALLHAKMGEYIFELAQKAAKDGEPIVRHLEYAFPHQGFESYNDQYMLGESYLVAPMIDNGETRDVKLPKGNWVDEQGKKYKGGQSVTMNVPLNRLIYFKLQK